MWLVGWVFYANNEIATVSRNSGQPDFTPKPPIQLLEKYQTLASSYYTVDYAELENVTWKVMEAGDGSVSGYLTDKMPNSISEYSTMLSIN